MDLEAGDEFLTPDKKASKCTFGLIGATDPKVVQVPEEKKHGCWAGRRLIVRQKWRTVSGGPIDSGD
jgi:hypothetical protein